MRVLKKLNSVFERLTTPELIKAVRDAGLTYLSAAKFKRILYCLNEISANRTLSQGHFAEFGIALGGSAIVLCKNLPSDSSRFFGFDVFGMIPPPSEMDDVRAHERYSEIKEHKSKGINGGTYYGYESDLYTKVVQNFVKFGLEVDNARINLVRGLFEDTLPTALPGNLVFAHIDCDWYQPVAFCLSEVSRKLLPGGYVVLDDYNDYGGCRKATDEFLAANSNFEKLFVEPNAVLRKAPSSNAQS